MYVVGGRQRAPRPLRSGIEQRFEYDLAMILRVDPGTGEVRTALEYESPPEVCPPDDPAILFKSATLDGDQLYVCTLTEVMRFQLPGFERTGYLSLPHFNDLHHVRPTPERNLLVAVTGLDMVLEISWEGTVLREWDVLGRVPWGRFSRETDYRLVGSTKPHEAHPNHVFYIGREPWVTRFEQRDAISLDDPARRIAIGLERIHDGVVHRGRVYFTTVDGKVAIADTDTFEVVSVVDLAPFHDDDTLLGWARGLLVDDRGLWVGFSRIRPTKFRENVAWLVRGFKRDLPTRVAYYDLAAGACLASIDLEATGLGAVFSVLPANLPRDS